MRINFRQGVVSYQAGGFLRFNVAGNVDIAALNRACTVTIAQKNTNYIHSEDNDVNNAWAGPFAASQPYWIYWDFDKLTFARTFGTTDLEPVAQSAEPGNGNAAIFDVVPGAAGIGQFIVGEEYVLIAGKPFAIVNSTANNGTYTVASSSYDGNTGLTTIVVNEVVPSGIADGEATLDFDSSGIPLLTAGRMWYDTTNNINYEWIGTTWREVLRVVAAQIVNGNTFLSWSINANQGDFTGTQIGDTSSVLAGRVLYTEIGMPIQRDDNTFFTTEDQFFTNQARVDAIRLESNVARAQSTSPSIAEFQPVAWTSDGRVQAAVYDDTGETVVGMLTEDLLYGDVGGIIIQGVVTNPAWTWTDQVPVGSDLWIDNGDLVPYDPHAVDPLNYPTPRVPVARVLATDMIVFEQGLGGVGPRGPVGTIDNLPPATVNELGAVTLVTPSSDPLFAYVISDTDSRLSDARIPLPHNHQGVDITITPTGDVSSNNAQAAIAELSAEKLAIAGGTMTGPLTLYGNPTLDLHAATKRYVDSLSIGLLWIDPIDGFINLIDDSLSVPPFPHPSDVYVVAGGGIGDWTGLDGHVVQANESGTGWNDRGLLSSYPTGTRFGVAMETPTVPGGTFIGLKNSIMTLLDPAIALWDGGYSPSSNDAVFVSNSDSLHAYHQYVFEAASGWVEFGGAQSIVPDNVTIKLYPGNVLGVIPYTLEGGTVDAKFLQGYEKSDFDLIYAAIGHNHNLLYSPLGHTHTDDEVTTSLFAGTGFGVPSDPSTIVLSASNVETNLQELMNKKASKLPSYVNVAAFPGASIVEGMFAYAEDTQEPFFSDGATWNKLSVDGHSHVLNLPYDISFFIAGNLLVDTIVGSFIATRNIHIDAFAPGSIAYADTPIPVAQPSVIFSIEKNAVQVGTITFAATLATGVISFPVAVDLVTGDRLQVVSPNPVDNTLKDITITMIACAVATPCTI